MVFFYYETLAHNSRLKLGIFSGIAVTFVARAFASLLSKEK